MVVTAGGSTRSLPALTRQVGRKTSLLYHVVLKLCGKGRGWKVGIRRQQSGIAGLHLPRRILAWTE